MTICRSLRDDIDEAVYISSELRFFFKCEGVRRDALIVEHFLYVPLDVGLPRRHFSGDVYYEFGRVHRSKLLDFIRKFLKPGIIQTRLETRF